MNMRLKRIALGMVLLAGLLSSSSSLSAAEKAFGGVGLQVVPTVRGELVVLKVVEGSPAKAVGLEPGDLIVKVDDFPLEGSDFSEVVSRRLWGEPGSSVTLTYLRPGVAGRKLVKLKRIPLDPDTKMTTPGVELILPDKK